MSHSMILQLQSMKQPLKSDESIYLISKLNENTRIAEKISFPNPGQLDQDSYD